VAARTKTTTDLRAQAIAWRHAQDALLCDAIEPWAHGSVLRTPSSPDYWDANAVRVEDAGLAAYELMAVADELLGDYRHRKLEVEDEATGAAAQPVFAAAGWLASPLAMMRRVGPATAHAGVEEVPFEATRTLRLAWYTEYGDDVEAHEQFARTQEPVVARRGMRAFVVGELGFTTLAVGDDAAEIDQLYVRPQARGQGLGARLLETALAASGRDVAWIVADDGGRPQALYERLGFETVWRPHEFVRRPI
jgi:ribosomal protein S18 acetylase RimI-like enzyme